MAEINLKKVKKKKKDAPVITRVTVYINDIAVSVLDWMEVRHALYDRIIPFGYRDGVISGEFLICDSDGYVKELNDTVVADMHYYVFPAEGAEEFEEE